MAKVILVDDEPVLLSALSRIISDSGYVVVAVTSGMAALATLAEPGAAAPDLIVTDVLMENIDGLQLFQTVRENPMFAHIPFIFVSASAKPELEKQIAGSSNAFFMRKPFEVEKLLARIAEVLAQA